MGKYNFDEVINRYNTDSLKYDHAVQRGKPAGILPLWVADMDFRTPKEVTEALRKKSEHGIFGYSEPSSSYFEALSSWFSDHFGWSPEPEKTVLSCGVVFAICNFIEELTKEGDAVLINQPVYYPFGEAITDNKRKLVNSSLVYRDGRYSMDFADFEDKIRENNVKLYILCNPHNPVGRVWTREELEKVLRICEKYGVFVISDEIHADFIYSGHRFNSFATLENADPALFAVCTAPTKTFNLAGLHNANIYIPDEGVRRKFLAVQNKKGYSQSNIMGIVACEAAYRYGEEWHGELLEYLEGNLEFVRTFVKEKLPGISLVEPEGTYLIWLDCSGLGIPDKDLNDLIVYKAGLWLDPGNIFGKEGEFFERINIACPRKTLKLAFEKLYDALDER